MQLEQAGYGKKSSRMSSKTFSHNQPAQAALRDITGDLMMNGISPARN
jgi:hypothetical protein